MADFAPGPGNDWTEEERALIRRLEARCRDVTHWELDCRHTDAGDPWCVIYDWEADRVVLHIARIDRRYVVVGSLQRRSETRTTMAAAVDLALSELEKGA